MDTRFLIFGILSTMFFAGIYSSSIFFVSAAPITSCFPTSKTTTICTVIDDDDDMTSWECKTSNGGKTWSCDKVKAAVGNSIPPGLNDALTAKVQSNIIDNNNDTKVPNDFLNKGGLLTKDNQITTNEENSATPPTCPNTGPIPPDCTMKPFLK